MGANDVTISTDSFKDMHADILVLEYQVKAIYAELLEAVGLDEEGKREVGWSKDEVLDAFKQLAYTLLEASRVFDEI